MMKKPKDLDWQLELRAYRIQAEWFRERGTELDFRIALAKAIGEWRRAEKWKNSTWRRIGLLEEGAA